MTVLLDTEGLLAGVADGLDEVAGRERRTLVSATSPVRTISTSP